MILSLQPRLGVVAVIEVSAIFYVRFVLKATIMSFWIENGSGFELQRLSCCEENLVKVQVQEWVRALRLELSR